MKHLLRLSMVAMLLILAACQPDESNPGDEVLTTDKYDDEIVQEWMTLVLKLAKETPGFSPPVAARSFGYIGLALYESVRPGMPGYQTMAGQVSDLRPSDLPQAPIGANYHWPAVANSALSYITKACYKPASEANKFAIDALEQRYHDLYRSQVNENVLAESEKFGRSMAASIATYCNSDGQELCYQNNFPAGYSLPSGTGFWVPTPPAMQPIPLQPFWGRVRTFAFSNNDLSRLSKPLPYSTDKTSLFYQQALETYATVNNLTPEQKLIAEYWSDDPGKTPTPPGHSIGILQQVLAIENANLALSAEAFAKVGMGVHDAFVACWNAKYTYNLMRPVTYINQQIDPNWKPILNTPPFPEYTSGHSTQSGASAQILSDLFGYNYAFVDRFHEARTDINGAPRTFSNFFDFANEAAVSRLYGGIHYRAGNEQGLAAGIRIGKRISGLKFKN